MLNSAKTNKVEDGKTIIRRKNKGNQAKNSLLAFKLKITLQN